VLDPALAAAARGHVVQYETLADLGAGHYSAATSVGEAFGSCVVGLGVAEDADGELVALDGSAWRIPADGVARTAEPHLGVAFAVAACGGRPVSVPFGGTLAEATAAVDAVLSGEAAEGAVVAAVRIDGAFGDVLLRSEPRQEPPYPPLADVLAHEVRFAFPEWRGTLAGFRFPEDAGGLTVPGLHLHGISQDRATGGHCHAALVWTGVLTVWVDDVAILVPSSPGRH
jgi:acetolactate decarboxylase